MFITIDLPPRPRKATALMRALGLLFLVAVVVATLYPMSNWALRAQGPFDFLGRGLPRFWTWFDVLSNVLAYLVLGLLLVGRALNMALKEARLCFGAIWRSLRGSMSDKCRTL